MRIMNMNTSDRIGFVFGGQWIKWKIKTEKSVSPYIVASVWFDERIDMLNWNRVRRTLQNAVANSTLFQR